ncbi:MAG: redox-regulated ATPase YchF [Gammaproteobacteria bacterium]|nr:redox-regulated ATPase YchF [Gammaproteobacteria bacterium]|tara:strand:- start:1250 stop:2341 length:1092 start_codon:yes stop_codon:yes gene_type:complete
MGFKCGIVGLPNVGKSTIFNALTNNQVAAENYPFCTIDPNVGVVEVLDSRLQELEKIDNPKQVVPASIEFVDIAGLVKGASKGEGLGNKFLSNIRETDAIVQVLRCFENSDITHVDGKINPISDLEVINMELILSDLSVVEKNLIRLEKLSRSGNKEVLKEMEALELVRDNLNSEKLIKDMQDLKNILSTLGKYNFLTTKPQFLILNVSDDDIDGNIHSNEVVNYAKEKDLSVITLSANIEYEISLMTDVEKNEYMEIYNLENTSLEKVAQTGYEILNLQTFFTSGEKETRAWTIERDSKAPDAAGKIHTDFKKGFIRAEVISFSDYIKDGGSLAAKNSGKMRLEGKDYMMQEGDVVVFRYNI